MQKFMVLYLAPAAGMAEWMQKPETERKEEERKMKAEWDSWMAAHAAMIKETSAAGKTTRITKQGVTDAANDLMLYSIVEGDSAESIAELFKSHPHFGIPGASIEVMPVRPM
ncbi:MAG TPA: hypothetical protein VHC68_01170 [Candidatus Paceibacterota bacterium]|nr:hypothetical protein [Candidatus Paceibacterota bacterium]